MGWHINVLDNTVKIPKKAEKELNQAAVENSFIYEGESIVYQGKLYFNSDHLEHMDYVWAEWLLPIAKKYKLNGDITFCSMDGDNAGSFWGYRFKNGDIKNLTGKIVWDEDRDSH